MNVEYLMQLLANRLNALLAAKDQAFMAGDLERINSLDSEINGVNDTLYKLNLLAGISAAATASGVTEAAIVANATGAVIDSGFVVTDATQCLQRYDITSYATDPLHEQSIATILSKMPLDLSSTEKIDQYIQNSAQGSPVSGAMVLAAAQIYAVDLRLMLAIMEQDSNFGLLGVGARTMNPGNVGNTGTDTRTYASWTEGVTAVAEWLSRHHKVVLAVEETKGNIVYETVATSTIEQVAEAPTPMEPSVPPMSVTEPETPIIETVPVEPVVVEVAPLSTSSIESLEVDVKPMASSSAEIIPEEVVSE